MMGLTFLTLRRCAQRAYFHFVTTFEGASISVARFPWIESRVMSLASGTLAGDKVKDVGVAEVASRSRKGKPVPIFHGADFSQYRRGIICAILYFLGARVGFLLTPQPHPVSTFWPANAILMAMLLPTPGKQWWSILVATFLAHLVVELGNNVPVSMVVCWYVSNCIEALVGAACIRRLVGFPIRFDTFRRMTGFIIAGPFLAPFVSSFIDAGFVKLIHWESDSYWEIYRMRFLSNALATLTVVPVMVMVGPLSTKKFRNLPWKRIFEGFILMGGLLAAGKILFLEDKLPVNIVSTLLYVPLPFLLWAAVRFGPLGLSTSMLMTALLTIWGAIHGLGPFGQMTPTQNVFSLQIFLIVMSVPLMLLSVVLEERKNVVQALSESETRFRVAADAIPAMLWMSGTDKRCTFFNQGWLDFTGRLLTSELGDGWAEGVHPDDLPSCLQVYTNSFDQRKHFRMEYRLRRKNGSYGWILDEGIPRYSVDGTFEGYIGMAVDITRAKETEAALGQSEKRFREVVESQPDLVCRFLADTTLTLVNEAFCRFFGKQRKELVGRSLLQLIPAQEHDRVSERISFMVQSPKIATFEYKTPTTCGVENWHQWIVYPAFDEAGHLVEFQATGRDITEQRKAAESLRVTNDQINKLARQLVHAGEEERRRIARELHDDFSQKLAAHAIALSNFGQSVVAGDSSVLERLEKLQDQAVSLSEDLRLVAHELHPHRLEQVGFESALRSFCGEFSALTQLKISLALELNGILPSDVALCCFRVVQESLRNTARHARAMKVQVYVHAVAGNLVLLVADDGVGIEERKRKEAEGLGLTSMAERIEMLSGEFHIGKRKTGGTLVAVEIPIT
jgi:PAS domain S-box-containing protein